MSVKVIDTQAWCTIDQHELGHALLTEEEIIEAVRMTVMKNLRILWMRWLSLQIVR